MITLQRTILLVDDSDEDRGTFRRYLERQHEVAYICHEAHTVAEGLSTPNQKSVPPFDKTKGGRYTGQFGR